MWVRGCEQHSSTLPGAGSSTVANVNVLNGADGLGEIATGLVGQGLTLLDSVRQNLGTSHSRADRNGESRKRALGPVD